MGLNDNESKSSIAPPPMTQVGAWPAENPFGGGLGPDIHQQQQFPQDVYSQPGEQFMPQQPIQYAPAPHSVQGQQPLDYPTSMASSGSQDYGLQESWMADQAFMPQESVGHNLPPSPSRTRWNGSAAVNDCHSRLLSCILMLLAGDIHITQSRAGRTTSAYEPKDHAHQARCWFHAILWQSVARVYFWFYN